MNLLYSGLSMEYRNGSAISDLKDATINALDIDGSANANEAAHEKRTKTRCT